jgi:hypothetical protein
MGLIIYILAPVIFIALLWFIGPIVMLARAKTWSVRIFALLLIGSFLAFPGRGIWDSIWDSIQERVGRKAEWQEDYEKALPVFHEHCKTASEFIYRTAEGVEGIQMDSILGFDEGTFLHYRRRGNYWVEEHEARGFWVKNSPPTNKGYRYVDRIWRDGERNRYTGRITEVANPPSIERNYYNIVKEPLDSDTAPRYGVSEKDLSKGMIKGSLLKVSDLQTREVMAERISYSLGDQACPPSGIRQKREFVEKVLNPQPR